VLQCGYAESERNNKNNKKNKCIGVKVRDIITHTNSGYHQFRGFGDSGGRSSNFSINLRWP